MAAPPLSRFHLRRLSFVVPAALFVMTAAVVSLGYVSSLRSTKAEELGDAVDALRLEASSERGTLEYLIAHQAVSQIQQELAERQADLATESAFVADEHGLIIAASRRSDLGQSLQSRVGTIEAAAVGVNVRAMTARVVTRMVGEVAVSEDGGLVLAVYPLVLGVAPGELRAGRIGVFIMVRDLEPYFTAARQTAAAQALLFGLPMGGFTLLLSVFSYLVITRRAAIVARAADRFAAGDSQVRTRLRGGDELAELGRAFDAMADRVSQSQQVVSEREELFRALVEQSADGVVLRQGDRVYYVNPAGCAIMGYTREELQAQTLEQQLGRVHPDDRERFLKRLRRRDTAPQREESRILRPDGACRWVTTSATAFTLNGQPATLTTFSDITERREAETARLALERQFHQAQKMEAVGTLAGGIAHDFNNILGVIVGNAALALQDVGPEHSARESLEQIARSGRRAADLVRQLLAISRPAKLERQLVHLPTVLREDTPLLRAMLPAGVEMSVAVDGEVPDIMANPTELHQVLLNICTNARQAMAGGAGTLRLMLSEVTIGPSPGSHPAELQPGRYARLAIQDSGIGMDAGTISRIFEPFFTTKDVGQGTGLGMAVVLGIMTSLQGAIAIASRPGDGTTVTLYFPAAAGGSPTPAPDASVAVPVGGGQHILILDDESPLVRMATRVLERKGYRVTGFSHVVDALDAIHAFPEAFDLLMVDFNMPGATGVAVAREVWTRRPGLPVLMVSGRLSDAEMAEVAATGIHRTLAKPYSTDDLCAAVHDLLTPASPTTPE